MSPYPFSEKRQSWWWLLLLFIPGIMRYCAKEGMAASTIPAQLDNVHTAILEAAGSIPQVLAILP
mgnify:FL=1